MKTPILFFSCLFWCVFQSSSIPFQPFPGLSTPSFAEAACGKVKACKVIRQREPNNPGCKGVPTECGGTPPKAPKPAACGLVEACKQMRKINPGIAKCKGVPTTCGSSPPPPPPPPPPPTTTGECECLPKELEGPGNLQIGNCLTRDPANNKHYCYVDRNNGCSDSKASRRLPDLIYSYEACVNQRKKGFAAPNESGPDECGPDECREDDVECFLALLRSPSKSEECREDDVECFLALLSSPAQSDFGNTGFSCSSVDCGCSNDDIDCHIECLNCIVP